MATTFLLPWASCALAFGAWASACTAEQDLGNRPKDGGAGETGAPSEPAHDGGGTDARPPDGADAGRGGPDAGTDGATPPAGKWVSRAPMPTIRQRLAAVFGPDGKLYAIGGSNEGSGPLATVEAYDPGADSWSTAPALSAPRESLAAVLGRDGRIYAIGGQSGDPSFLVEAYTPGETAWVRAPSLPEGRTSPAAAAGKDGKIYVLGGHHAANGSQSSVVTYEPGAAEWTNLAWPMTSPRAEFGAAVSSDGTLYAAGGYGSHNEPLGSVESFLPGTPGWHTAPGLAMARIAHTLAVAGDGRVHALGGDRGPSGTPMESDSHEAFDPQAKRWQSARSMTYGGRAMAAATGPDGKIYVVGGATWIGRAGGPSNGLLVFEP